MIVVMIVMMTTSLNHMCSFREVSEELNKMRSKERYLNNQFSTLCHDFKEVRIILLHLFSLSPHLILHSSTYR